MVGGFLRMYFVYTFKCLLAKPPIALLGGIVSIGLTIVSIAQ